MGATVCAFVFKNSAFTFTYVQVKKKMTPNCDNGGQNQNVFYSL